MSILKSIFKGFGACIKYINTYFKTFVFLFIVFLIFAPSGEKKEQNYNLARLDLKSEITNVNELLEKIENVKNDERVMGVLLVIDSPGGAFAPSMELALSLEKLKNKKPLVVYVSGTMASGSYLAGVSANKILANPAAFIGSIGVIIQGADISELAEMIGIKSQVIKAGDFKEAGTFMRAWNEKEKQSLQELVNKSYALFTQFVAAHRKLNLNEANQWANARVFLANEAKELKLIDSLSDLQSAKEELKKLAGLEKGIFKEESKLDKFIEKLNTQVSLILTQSIKSLLSSSRF